MVTSTKGDNGESKKKKIDGNKDVDPQLWHAVAGTTVQIPQVNSKIFYFPQGHAEHAYEPVNFPADINIPSKIPCRVAAVHYRADPRTDLVYAKLRLVPLQISQVSIDEDNVAGVDDMSVTKNQYQSYTKTLSESDINKSGGFSCPKKCAETMFPPLDYSDQLPSQDIYLMDVHGEMWKFRHVYATRNILTTGWSDFVTNKQLELGDSLVFVKAANSDLHIGIRRSKKRNDCRFNFPSKRKPETGTLLQPPYGGLSSSLGNERRIGDKVIGIGKVKAEDVIEAVKLGVNMQPFDVVYYPRVGTPEFFVKTSLIRTALQIGWDCGMRFQMAIETDSSKINWLMGTIASVEAADPAWPDSLWRLLQVTWDNPDLVTNTKRLNPWQVETLRYMSSSKELGLPQLPTFPMDGQFSMPYLPNYFQTPKGPIMYLPETSMPYFQQPFNRDDATTLTTVSNNPACRKVPLVRGWSVIPRTNAKKDASEGETVEIENSVSSSKEAA
ncbi:unnamed protein product [Vicia faba]|uniref:Auxin response factor n=1 Tax=Vicia faba TaxID=3906 RepID=A0AAV1AZJ8_VICFA|nr:unnamed protein product [Vicia faba]